MGKSPRENRVPIMFSDAELEALDDWRFKNRVATRAEAIRRLCQIGLVFEEQSKFLTLALAKAFKEMHQNSVALKESSDDAERQRAFLKANEVHMDFVESVVLPFGVLQDAIETMGAKKDMTDALEEIEKYRRFMKAEHQILKNRAEKT